MLVVDKNLYIIFLYVSDIDRVASFSKEKYAKCKNLCDIDRNFLFGK